MAENLRVGTKVTWNSHGGTVTGKIVKIARENGSIGDFDYKASKDDPRYIVETEEGKKAAHKAEGLKRAATKKASDK